MCRLPPMQPDVPSEDKPSQGSRPWGGRPRLAVPVPACLTWPLAFLSTVSLPHVKPPAVCLLPCVATGHRARQSPLRHPALGRDLRRAVALPPHGDRGVHNCQDSCLVRAGTPGGEEGGLRESWSLPDCQSSQMSRGPGFGGQWSISGERQPC